MGGKGTTRTGRKKGVGSRGGAVRGVCGGGAVVEGAGVIV